MDLNKPTRTMRFIPKLPSHEWSLFSSDQSTSNEAAEERHVDAQSSSEADGVVDQLGFILRHYAISSSSKAGGYVANEISFDVADESDCDMHLHSPISLPWRTSHSGDQVPDDDESEDNATDMEYDENTVNDAAVLRLFLPDLQKLEQTTEDVVGSSQQGLQFGRTASRISGENASLQEWKSQTETGRNLASSLDELVDQEACFPSATEAMEFDYVSVSYLTRKLPGKSAPSHRVLNQFTRTTNGDRNRTREVYKLGEVSQRKRQYASEKVH
ncbi:hypothetical protein AKJ16_DCAP06634 [Drosera capensis]